MLITVYNFKGGQGKSKISINLALTMDYAIITNDLCSSNDLLLPKERFLKINKDEKFPEGLKTEDNIIFDLGGYIDNRVIDVLKISDVILVPVIQESNDEENIRVTIKTIDSIKKYNNNIIIIANKIEKKSGKGSDLLELKDTLNKLYDFPIYPIKKSKVVGNIFKKKKSIKEISEENGLNAFLYKEIVEQFEFLIKKLEKYNNLN